MTARARTASFRVAEALLRPPVEGVTRRDWRGAEHLPRTQGFVAVSNHVSYLDPLTLAHFLLDHGCPPRFLAKASVFRIPVGGRLIAGAGQIPVTRGSADAAKALAAAVEAVEAGECVVVYPEATLTRDPDGWPMAGKTGAARIALATGCPVVPVAQWGPQFILPAYGKLPTVLWRPKVVHVWAGPPVDLTPWQGPTVDAAVLAGATEAIMSALTGILEQIRGEPAPARRWDPAAAGQPATGDPRAAGRGGAG